jgi:hypothetical protein
MIREELAILSLNPTTVQPHIHAIVPTSELSETAIHLLNRWTETYCDEMGDSVTSKPSIRFSPIPTEADFERIVRYIHKPIDLVTPYQARRVMTVDDQDRSDLNRATRDIIEATIILPKDRVQVDYFGNILCCFLNMPGHAQDSQKEQATGYFHTQLVNGRWLLVSSNGTPFFPPAFAVSPLAAREKCFLALAALNLIIRLCSEPA